MNNELLLGHGAVKDPFDHRDKSYDIVAGMGEPVDWAKGFDIEKELNFTLPVKDQSQSESCVGQSFSYYAGVLHKDKTGTYDEASAKEVYSQIFLPSGGANFRDAASLLVSFGWLFERVVNSHKPDGSVDETFMRDLSWKTPANIAMAKTLCEKEYRGITGFSMDVFAQAIRDNHGVVGGITGTNNGTWFSGEPQPPTGKEAQSDLWGHALYFGKFGIDKLGKYIATPNSWGTRTPDALHPDGWQKLRQPWFDNQGAWIFSPWTLTENLTINKPINMTIIQQQGIGTLYVQVGDTLIPFNTDFATYQTDFSNCQIIVITPDQFKKFKVASAVVINKK